MFKGCTNLRNINLEGLKTDNIKIMISMFENCDNLEYLNIQNLNTKNALYFTNIFYDIKNCINITYTYSITHNNLRREINKISCNKE